MSKPTRPEWPGNEAGPRWINEANRYMDALEAEVEQARAERDIEHKVAVNLEAENAELRDTNARLAEELCKDDDRLTHAVELLRGATEERDYHEVHWLQRVDAFLSEMEDTHE